MGLNVLMLAGFPPPYGGVSVWSRELAENLVTEDVNVSCILLYGVPPKGISVYAPAQRFYTALYELKWIVSKLVDLWRFGITPLSLRFGWLMLMKTLLDSTQIRNTLSHEQYDVILANHAAFGGLSAIFLADLTGAKSVVYEHGGGVIEFPYSFKGAGKITSYVLSKTSAVVVASKFMKKKVAEWGADLGKVFVIPPMVNIKKFECNTQRKELILFIGALEKRKDPQTLLKSIPYVLEKFPCVKFIFIGSGSLLPKLRLETEQMGIAKNVLFMGKTLDELKIRILSQAKILVLPSVREPFGIVLVEALASGTPCIATRVGGISEIINNEVGVLIPPKKPKVLANAIIGIMSDEEKWEEMSKKAKVTAVKYDTSGSINDFIDLLIKLKTRNFKSVYSNE